MRYPYLWDDWRDRGACRDQPAEWFVPEGYHKAENTERAVSICAECPVSLECFLAALVEEDEYGIRGGTTPEERAA